MGKWDAFGSPGTGATAAERIELANIEAGLGTDKERARTKKKEKKTREKRRAAKAAALVPVVDAPMWSDPRFIGGGLLLTGVLVAVWYSKKNATKKRAPSSKRK